MIGSLARTLGRGEVPGPEPFNAPLFQSLVAAVPEDERWVVLDLGAACPQVINLFGGHRCRLDIADITDDLHLLNKPLEGSVRQQVAESLLPELHAEAVDVVLCWDTLNYLSREALTTLMARIADRSRRGTLVHTLICYSDPDMPVNPGHYVPQDEGGLLNTSDCDETRDAPRYSPEDLTLSMEGYSIERAMLLSNGMQEFLFRL